MTSQTALLALALSVLVILRSGVRGVCGYYVPAQPSNGSTIQGTDRPNSSALHLQWYENGSGWEYLAPYAEAGWHDPVRGILVHFTENSVGSGATATPWVAFVNCDASSSSDSEVDVFALAKDRGAKAAILYSIYSETCVVDPGYRSALDVFATQSLNASLHIRYELGQSGSPVERYFDASMLNGAAQAVNSTIASGRPTAPGFLFATLLAYGGGANVLGAGLRDANGTSTTTNTTGGSQNTGVAMIVLYVITGCVSALFCAVIVSGAIRAIRYPERYGPRAADPALGGGQSRAGGLGRAILDTFPIVKFRSSGNDRESDLARRKDVESMPMETGFSAPEFQSSSGGLSSHEEHYPDRLEGTTASGVGQGASPSSEAAGLPPRTSTAEHDESHAPASTREADARMPDCIGRETCPICIVDFEEGDDLRVLPCEGKHRFHQSCVDPWLLELSGSCPICRQDFHALETILSGETGSDAAAVNRNSGMSTTPNRFSRYLRFARRRQRSIDEESPSPTES